MTTDDLTKEQLSAIRSLERALRKVSKSGVSLFGMDNNIFAWYGDAEGDPYEDTKFGNNCIRVNSHGAYIDSGGH